jgi:large subunit ribosomal protein L10
LLKEEKKEFVDWMKNEFNNAQSVVAADYRGLDVAQMTELRAKCREVGVSIRVVKNTLTLLASKDTPVEPISELLTGPTAVAWHSEDPGAPAKVLVNFAKVKANVDLEIKGAALSGRLLSADEVKNVLATMASHEELMGKMAGLLLAGPQKLHSVLSAGPNMLGRLLGALKDKKE